MGCGPEERERKEPGPEERRYEPGLEAVPRLASGAQVYYGAGRYGTRTGDTPPRPDPTMRDYYRRTIAFARDTMRQPVKAGRDLHFSDLAFFLRFARPIWRVGVLALIATALVSAAKTVLPLSIKFFIDNVLLGETPDPGSLLAGASGLLSSLNALIVALLEIGRAHV